MARHDHHSTEACHCQPGPVPSVYVKPWKYGQADYKRRNRMEVPCISQSTEINCSKGLVTSTTTQTRRHIDLRHGLSHQNPLVPLGLLCLLGFQDLGVGIGTSFWGSGADRPRRALTFTTQEAQCTSMTTQEAGSLHQEWMSISTRNGVEQMVQTT